jgi:hypothetical protein
MLFYFACEAAGALSIRLSLRPLNLWAENILHDSGASRRGARNRVRVTVITTGLAV